VPPVLVTTHQKKTIYQPCNLEAMSRNQTNSLFYGHDNNFNVIVIVCSNMTLLKFAFSVNVKVKQMSYRDGVSNATEDNLSIFSLMWIRKLHRNNAVACVVAWRSGSVVGLDQRS